jgi:hypothetical protein
VNITKNISSMVRGFTLMKMGRPIKENLKTGCHMVGVHFKMQQVCLKDHGLKVEKIKAH